MVLRRRILKPCSSLPTWTLGWWRGIIPVPCAPLHPTGSLLHFRFDDYLCCNFPRASHVQALGKNKWNIGGEPCSGSIFSHCTKKVIKKNRICLINWLDVPSLHLVAALRRCFLSSYSKGFASHNSPDRCSKIWDDAWATNRTKLRSFIFNSAGPLFMASIPEQR